MGMGTDVEWGRRFAIFVPRFHRFLARSPRLCRDLESCQIYPQRIAHSPNGRFVSVCGDGEYIIYTAMGWRNTTFGNAMEFVWAADSKEYAICDSSSRIAVFEMKEKTKKEKTSYRPSFTVDSMYGGQLLAIRGSDFVEFREWSELRLVRVIESAPHHITWNDSGDLMALCSEGIFYIIRYRSDVVDAALSAGGEVSQDGIPDSFEGSRLIS